MTWKGGKGGGAEKKEFIVYPSNEDEFKYVTLIQDLLFN